MVRHLALGEKMVRREQLRWLGILSVYQDGIVLPSSQHPDWCTLRHPPSQLSKRSGAIAHPICKKIRTGPSHKSENLGLVNVFYNCLVIW